MNANSQILNLKTRKNIYNLIYRNPGLHLRELERQTNIPLGTLRYHLKYLKKQKIILSKNIDGRTRHFITKKINDTDQKLLTAFRNEHLTKIILIFILVEEKKIFFKEDFKKLPFEKNWKKPSKIKFFTHHTTINSHLKKLVELGILETVKVKRRKGFILKNSEEIWDFLIRYQHILKNIKINSSLIWLDVRGVPDKIETVINEIYNVFPHPYHV